ncbi:DUF2219 family protein [Hyphomonadaceae bacterium ML37]|nr:DUF2219 family protein [Hyphomonadaceae bacterium ML37]
MTILRIIASSLSAAALAAGLTGIAAHASPGDLRPSVIAPLLEELGASPQPGSATLQALDSSAPVSGLRFDARDEGFTTVRASVRPRASRLASGLLGARAPVVARDMLAGFETSETLLAATPAGGRFTVSFLNGEEPSAMTLAFGDDYAEAAGYALAGERDRPRRMTLRYEGAFDAPGQDGLDIGLSPRAGVSVGDYGPAAQAGATVRLGRFIGEDAGWSRPAWWFFAGADRQALLYDPGSGFTRFGAMTVAPYAMVGDAQAGIAMRLGGADLSLAYVRRETTYSLPAQSWDTNEGFAAFSLTLRR